MNYYFQKWFMVSLVIGTIVMVIIIGVAYVVTKPNQTQNNNQQPVSKLPATTQESNTTAKELTTSPDVPQIPKAKTPKEIVFQTFTGTVLAGTSDPLLDFIKDDYDKAVASDNLVVLYFHANWCPVCKIEYPQAQAAFNELTGGRVVGFRVHFNDNETGNDEKNLARQFGVPYQHVKVFIKDGKQVLKVLDQWDKARYLAEIKKALAN